MRRVFGTARAARCGALLCLLATAPLSAQVAPDSQLMYELLNRLQLLEQEIRQLRGDLEVYKYQQDRASASGDQYAALEQRVRALEQQLGVTALVDEEPAVVVPQEVSDELAVAPTPAPAALPPLNAEPASAAEQAAFEQAYMALQQGGYQRAIDGFEDFLRSYPGSSLAADAQYWLGESYYVTRDFEQAQQVFLRLGSNYPQAEKLPDAMLKLGYVYENLDARAKARQVYEKLLELYPQHRTAVLAQERLQALR